MDTTPVSKTVQEILLNAILKGVPYSDQVSDIGLSEEDAVRFTWRGESYRVNVSSGGAPRASTIDKGMLVGDSKAILLGHCVAMAWAELGMPLAGEK
jgi:hypothetical protein